MDDPGYLVVKFREAEAGKVHLTITPQPGPNEDAPLAESIELTLDSAQAAKAVEIMKIWTEKFPAVTRHTPLHAIARMWK